MAGKVHSNGYTNAIDAIRDTEYPMLGDAVYLDHAGKPPAAKSLIERFSRDITSELYGNPHAMSVSSQRANNGIETARLSALRLFKADPAHFDLVFVANATAGIKLVAECLRKHPNGFRYVYHGDAHTSLVGAREEATAGSECLQSDVDVETWLCELQTQGSVNTRTERCREVDSSTSSSCASPDWTGSTSPSTAPTSDSDDGVVPPRASGCVDTVELFAWPAQSNMNGRRLPLDWAERARVSAPGHRHTLLDAAALVSTSPLDLSNADKAPDFTVLSFYKMFGFPELGALIVRKASAHLLGYRAYFGGGTVDMVSSLKEQWHLSKGSSIHAALEDGTAPIHNIKALDIAIKVHEELYGSFDNVAQHTASLMQNLFVGLRALVHFNGQAACRLYSTIEDAHRQGPIIAFNILDSSGNVISCTEVERLASLHNIHLRPGGLCNPGGIARMLELSPWDLKQNLSAGHKCGSENDIVQGRPTGMVRVSVGPMSNTQDIEKFVRFLTDVFVEPYVQSHLQSLTKLPSTSRERASVVIEQMLVYPIKSCAGWSVPPGSTWGVSAAGLAWDREWCIVHAGTGDIITQKRCPRMALVCPRLDLHAGQLVIQLRESSSGHMEYQDEGAIEFAVPLSRDPAMLVNGSLTDNTSSTCTRDDQVRLYKSVIVSNILSKFLEMPCQLARFPPVPSPHSSKHAKPHLRSPILQTSQEKAHGVNPFTPGARSLSNESPILAISRESLTQLNKEMVARHSNNIALVHASAFRPNIVFATSTAAYDEDHWTSLQNTLGLKLQVLGACRRCQMVCTIAETGERRKDAEPLATLTKTRRRPGGGAWFGVHMRLDDDEHNGTGGGVLRSGDEFVVL